MKILYFLIYTALFSIASCGGNNKQSTEPDVAENSTSMSETIASGGITDDEPEISTTPQPGTAAWIVDNSRTEASMPEFEGTDIKLYETDDFRVYSLTKGSLFTTGSAGLRAEADQTMQKVSGALQKRHEDGQINIYGYIDATDNPNYNRDVAERRANAVKEWLVKNGNIEAERIVVHPIVEVPTPPSGILEDHRFEIVVKKAAV